MEPIKARIHREVASKAQSITLEADAAGNYYAVVFWEDGLLKRNL